MRVIYCFASGYRNATSGAFSGTGIIGYVWSCGISGNGSSYLRLADSVTGSSYTEGRVLSFSVRCVQYLLLLVFSLQSYLI